MPREEVEKLREENSWVVEYVEGSPLAMIALDSSRRIIAVSDGVLAQIHVGRTRDKVLGTTPDANMSREKAEEWVALFQMLLETGHASGQVAIVGVDGVEREFTALYRRDVAPGIHLGASLASVDLEAPSVPGRPGTTSVLVSAPDPMSTSVVTALLEQTGVLSVIPAHGDGPALEALMLAHHPQVTLISTSPFGRPGSEAPSAEIASRVAAALRFADENDITTEAVVMTHQNRPDLARASLAAGARGILGPYDNPSRLGETLVRLAAGDGYISPSLVAAIAGDGELAGLTDREIDVLRLLALGYTNQEVAEKLYLSIRTVEGHHSTINGHIGSPKRRDLVEFAIKNQVIP